ncbi:MAG TPA: hypothetical protein PKZ07_14575 [Sedimentisphaerales bacterium]|nr:hypothetical protein [Sedimentisphaerales bacterium]
MTMILVLATLIYLTIGLAIAVDKLLFYLSWDEDDRPYGLGLLAVELGLNLVLAPALAVFFFWVEAFSTPRL